MTKSLTFLLILITGSFSQAQINMKDAAYTKTLNDFGTLGLQKIYSSRSLHRGIFGFGWCSSWEVKLQILSRGRALRQHCGRTDLVQILKRKDFWHLHFSGEHEIFNRQGQLIEKPIKNLKLLYSHTGRISEIQTAGRRYRIEWDEAELQIRAIASGKWKITYEYSQGNLLKIQSPEDIMNFRYDTHSNLTDFRSHRGFEKMTYHLSRDEIQSFESSQSPCRYQFQFRKLSSTVLESKVEKICPGSQIQALNFLFRGRKAADGRLVLNEIKTQGALNDLQNLL
jgi:hypothetical protein